MAMTVKKRMKIFLSLLCSILLISGCVSSGASSSGGKNTPESLLEQVSLGKRYLNNKYKFEVTVPNGWSISQGIDGALISAEGNVEGYSGGSIAVIVKPLPNNFRDADLDRMTEAARKEFHDSFVEAYIRSHPGVKIVQPLSGDPFYETLGGKKAILVSAMTKLANNVSVQNRSFVVLKGGYIYQYVEATLYSAEDVRRDLELIRQNKTTQMQQRGERVAGQFKAVQDTFKFR